MRKNIKAKAVPAVKLMVFGVVTVVSTISVMRFFGRQITQSAYRFTFGEREYYISVPDSGSSEPEEEIPSAIAAPSAPQPEPAVAKTVSQGDPDSIAVNLSATSGKYKVFGGTSVINNTKYDISELLYSEFKRPEPKGEEPYVLIYHTHTSESYYGGGSVIDVGNAMAQEFERLGYKTVHITEYYDREHFSGAYSRSIVGVKEALEKNPSIKLCFDVHRDSITGSNGVDYRPITEVDGKTAAQVMLICGTDAKGLEHPDWRENFKFALDLSRTMSKMFPSLSRPVNLRGDRFNTHVTHYSLLMEVGSDANTVEEAKLAAIFTARAVAKTIENK